MSPRVGGLPQCGDRKLILPLGNSCGPGLPPPALAVYDVAEEPGERNDVAGSLPRAEVTELLTPLRAWRDDSLAFAARSGADRDPGVALDGRTLRHLEALGYLETDRGAVR